MTPCRPFASAGRPHDAGSGTVWTLAAAMVVLVVAVAVVGVGGAVVARHRAGSAADLAALAAAGRAAPGASGACELAARVVAADGGRLRACTVSGAVVEVTVAVEATVLGHRLGTAVGRARAGPAGP